MIVRFTGALLLSLVACSPAPTVTPPPETIILISIDTLRRDHLGTYGYERDTSPFIDSFAAGSTVFENAISTSSWTLPAHASLMLSEFPHVHGVTGKGTSIKRGAATLAQGLASAGYRTGGFYSSTLLSERYGFEQGFDHLERPKASAGSSPGAAVNAAALSWIDQGDGPAFLFLHYYDVHAPYRTRSSDRPSFTDELSVDVLSTYEELSGLVASRFLSEMGIDTAGVNWEQQRQAHREVMKLLSQSKADEETAHAFKQHMQLNRGLTQVEQDWLIALYDDGISHQDLLLAQMMTGLQARGMLEHAMVWIVSDHGEMLFDHHGFRDHAKYLNEAIAAVPMIVRIPGQQRGRRLRLPPVSLVDVMPTIFDYVGLDSTGSGQSLRPLIDGSGTVPDRPLFVEVASDRAQRRAVVVWPWKMMIDDSGGDELQIYNLAEDPGEQHDLAGEQLEVRQVLEEFLENSVATSQTMAESKTLEADEIKELRALGYIQ